MSAGKQRHALPSLRPVRSTSTGRQPRFLRERDSDGHRLVVRNGRAKPRSITTGVGEVEVQAPRINDKRVVDGQRCKFTSKILPPYMRKSPKVAEVLLILYLQGLSSNDFRSALESLLGDKTVGL